MGIIYRFLEVFSLIFGSIIFIIGIIPNMIICSIIYIITGKEYFTKFIDLLLIKSPIYFSEKTKEYDSNRKLTQP